MNAQRYSIHSTDDGYLVADPDDDGPLVLYEDYCKLQKIVDRLASAEDMNSLSAALDELVKETA